LLALGCQDVTRKFDIPNDDVCVCSNEV